MTTPAAEASPAPSPKLIAAERAFARVERKAAIAAHKATRVPPKARYRWDRRAGPRKPKSAIELQREEVAEIQRDIRDRRAPSGDAALAAERARLEDAYGHRRGGTPRTYDAAQRRFNNPLFRLCQAGAITADELAAAIEIAEIAERIGRDVSVRTASLETRVDGGRHGGATDEALGRVRREVAYTRWRARLGNARPLALAMIVGDPGGTQGPVGYSVAAKLYRVRAARAKAVLQDALDLWATEFAWACRAIDETDLRLAAIRCG